MDFGSRPPDERDIVKLFQNLRKFLEYRDVTSASYRLVSAFHSQLDRNAQLFHFGFPDDWVKLYDDNLQFRRHDPVADFIMGVGHYMTWQQAIDAQELTEGQQEFVRQMHAHGVIDGVALPLYGPRGREAYSTYSFGRHIIQGDQSVIDEINAYFEQFHTQVILLSEREWQGIIGLSPRENEVLMWMARGKSNGDIAVILDIAPNTVATHVKRLFRKLRVNDRMAATLKGLQYGIVQM